VTNRNRFRQRQNVHKRANLWLPFAVLQQETTTGSTLAVDTMLDRYLADHGAELPVGSTIGPIRGNFHYHAEAAGFMPVVFVAVYLTPEGGIATDPVLEDEQVDAMWYATASYNGIVSETAAGTFSSIGENLPLHTKAMRKITSIGQQLTVQVDEVQSGGDVIWDLTGHIFIRLP